MRTREIERENLNRYTGTLKMHLKLTRLPPTPRFEFPEDVAVDAEGYAYVADTGNHAIRMVSPDGRVSTVAGTGTAGSLDGVGANATFSSPSGVAVWYDWQWWTIVNPIDEDSVIWKNGNGSLALFVADTENHRIRKITGDVTYDSDNRKQVRFDNNLNTLPTDRLSNLTRFNNSGRM